MAEAAEEFPPSAIPARGVLMGVDYGTKRIGIALSTPEQSIASAVEIVPRKPQPQEAKWFREMAENYRVVGIVVGLPIHVSGEESQKSREARTFSRWLLQTCKKPVAVWDERFTSAVAEEYLLAAELTSQQRKKRIDMLAAQILLQAFLDARAPRANPDDIANL